VNPTEEFDLGALDLANAGPFAETRKIDPTPPRRQSKRPHRSRRRQVRRRRAQAVGVGIVIMLAMALVFARGCGGDGL
jgi:hypothetical protein